MSVRNLRCHGFDGPKQRCEIGLKICCARCTADAQHLRAAGCATPKNSAFSGEGAVGPSSPWNWRHSGQEQASNARRYYGMKVLRLRDGFRCLWSAARVESVLQRPNLTRTTRRQEFSCALPEVNYFHYTLLYGLPAWPVCRIFKSLNVLQWSRGLKSFGERNAGVPAKK